MTAMIFTMEVMMIHRFSLREKKEKLFVNKLERYWSKIYHLKNPIKINLKFF